MNRTVRRQHPATRDDIGELETRRPLPNPRMEQLDPFLFLNHHGPQVYPPHNRGLPFGPHPHRGFETVTFIVEGSLAHKDSGGHQSVINQGGVQWMTAGRGLVHEEISPHQFLQQGGPLEILQLWVNLPSRLKMTEPRYVGLQRDQIPVVDQDGARIQVISGAAPHPASGHPRPAGPGEEPGVRGPIESLIGIAMMTVALQPGARVTLPAPAAHTVFLYVVRGAVRVAGQQVEHFRLVELNDDGDSVDIEAVTEALVLYGHGAPIGEPVVAHGPFVMNTREEIVQAFRDYQAGKFN
ncbi:MAG TPA: pirin family protein [Thermoanaerobaculia bacterium]|jgi:redox-sensitive bicupin YhaK (pirin superfamily)|nr:pirin family protein [Thermoanaerobaculia bacterium]